MSSLLFFHLANYALAIVKFLKCRFVLPGNKVCNGFPFDVQPNNTMLLARKSYRINVSVCKKQDLFNSIIQAFLQYGKVLFLPLAFRERNVSIVGDRQLFNNLACLTMNKNQRKAGSAKINA